MLRFRGSQHLRQRLLFSTLSGKPIRVDGIREDDEEPGLRDFEASVLRLFEKVTDGCAVEISETGTTLRYKPGLITGGTNLTHDCGKSRAIGYFLEPLVCLALFGKKPLGIRLTGITNDAVDPGVDIWRTVTFPLTRQLVGPEALIDLQLKVLKRGAAPGGGGEVAVHIPPVRLMPPVHLVDEGMVKRVRGVAYSMRTSPQMANRMVDAARSVLNALLADVFVFTDHMPGHEAGASPGFGLALVAETTSGRLLGAEATASLADRGESGQAPLPEDVGHQAAYALLEEVRRGGIADSSHQSLVLTLCALGPEELSEVRLGPLTNHAVRTLRHLKAFFGTTFAVRPQRNSETLFLSCIGAGVRNMSRKVT